MSRSVDVYRFRNDGRLGCSARGEGRLFTKPKPAIRHLFLCPAVIPHPTGEAGESFTHPPSPARRVLADLLENLFNLKQYVTNYFSFVLLI